MSEASRKDDALICELARRAVDLAATFGSDRDVLTLSISLTKWHEADPIDLPGLLAATDADISHDVFGIDRHMDRETGKPDGVFLPRYAQTDELYENPEFSYYRVKVVLLIEADSQTEACDTVAGLLTKGGLSDDNSNLVDWSYLKRPHDPLGGWCYPKPVVCPDGYDRDELNPMDLVPLDTKVKSEDKT